MADVFGTPAEQIILQGTQLLQSAFRARSQIQLERAKFEEEKKHNNDVFQLQQQKLDLERESLELERMKAQAGPAVKPLAPEEQDRINESLEKESREFLDATFKSQGWQILGRTMTEIENQIKHADFQLREAARQDAQGGYLTPAEYQADVAKYTKTRQEHQAAWELMRQDVTKRVNEHEYRRQLEGETPQVRETAPKGKSAPVRPLTIDEASLSKNRADIFADITKQRATTAVPVLKGQLRKQVVEHGRTLAGAKRGPELGAFFRMLAEEGVERAELNDILTNEINFTLLR